MIFKAIFLMAIISLASAQTAAVLPTRVEVIPFSKYPLYNDLAIKTSLDTLITSLNTHATSALDSTNLFSVYSQLVTLLINDAIKNWNDATKANSLYRNFANEVQYERDDFRLRYTTVQEEIKIKSALPESVNVINQNIEAYRKVENFIRFVNATDAQIKANLTRVENLFDQYKEESQRDMETCAFFIKKADEWITETQTELTTMGTSWRTKLNARVTFAVNAMNTFSTALGTIIADYMTKVNEVYAAILEFWASKLQSKSNEVDTLITEYTAANTALTADSTANVNDLLSKITPFMTASNAKIATYSDAAINTAITTGKELWNIMLQANDSVEVFNRERLRFNAFLKDTHDKAVADFANLMVASHLHANQIDSMIDRVGSSIQALRRINEAILKTAQNWGSHSLIFEDRFWSREEPFTFASVTNLQTSQFRAYSFELNTLGIYTADVKIKYIDCFQTDYNPSLLFIYRWNENGSATPPSFKLILAINSPFEANGNIKCVIFYDTTVVANQIGSPLENIESAITAFDNLPAATFA